MQRQIDELHARLAEAEETLGAIRRGEVDAIVCGGSQGEQVFTLKGADHPYRVMVEQMSEAAATLSATGTILFCNPALPGLLELSQEQVLGQPFQEFVSPGDQEAFEAFLGQVGGGKARGEVRLRSSLGRDIPVLLSLSVLPLHGREVVSMVATDLSTQRQNEELHAAIEERKRVEASLRESEERLSLALDSGQMGMWEWDVRLDQSVWNAKEYEILGLPVSDGREPTGRFFERVHQDDLPALHAGLADLMREGRYWRDEFRIIRPDGEVRWMAAQGRLFRDPGGQPSRMIGVNYDITERKRAEEALREREKRFRTLAHLAPAGVYLTDQFGRCAYVNEKWLAMAGFASPEQAYGDGWISAIHPEDRERVNEAWEHMVETRGSWGVEYRFITPEGRTTWIFGVATRLVDERGQIIGYIGVNSDITDAKALKEALVRAKESAEEANRAKSEFLANMSHEIRTPMNGILGMTELALMEDVSPRARGHLELVRQSGRCLLDIINDILDLSKIESGKLILAPEPFALRNSVEAALQTLEVSAQAKGIAFHHAIDADLPDHLLGDPGRLRQVLTNLVGNAIKFTHQGAVRVSISRDHEPAPPGAVRLLFRVKDDGIGIPRDKLGEVFEAFSQAGLSSHVKYGGTGLGLSISKSLVEKMGGRIWVDSAPGKGTTFYFTIEVGLAEDGAAPPAPEHPAPPRPELGLHVLLVEDNLVNRLLAEELLKRRGHRVEVAENGREALDKLRAGAFDLVLMDVRMPDMNGLEALKAIRHGELGAAAMSLPVVAVTAHALTGDRECFLEQGFDEYVSKPIDLEALDLVLARIKTKETRKTC